MPDGSDSEPPTPRRRDQLTIRAAESSVRNLGALYSVVVGVALAFAMESVIDPAAVGSPFQWHLLPLFFVLVVTLIPFYHGALRHLDVTYVEHGGKDVRAGALLADFLLLFLEGSLFVALAVLMARPEVFAWTFVALLVLDTIWGFTAHLAFSKHPVLKAEARWAIINAVAVAVLILFLILIGAYPPGVPPTAPGLEVGLLMIALVRTVLDYMASWEFYTS